MRGALVAALIGCAAPAAAAERPSTGWWVVLGSSPAPDSTGTEFPAATRASAAARRCGVDPFTDFSSKFAGFAPDLMVAVDGAYPTASEARAALARVRPCIPDAYLRRGSYAGE